MDSWTQAQVYVGNANADFHMAGILELELLKRNALRPSHHVLEIGCGALVGGRPIIQYLDPDRYVGIEPNTWLIEEARDHFPDSEELFSTKRPILLARTDFDGSEVGRVFDFVFSHSILSHAAHWQLHQFIAKAEKVLAPNGIIIASIRFADDKGQMMGDSKHEEWQYPGTSYFAFATVLDVAEQCGLHAEHRSDYREFFTRYLPSNFHDWVRLRRLVGGRRMSRPTSLYGEPDPSGKESSG